MKISLIPTVFVFAFLFVLNSKSGFAQSDSSLKFNNLPESIQLSLKQDFKKYVINSIDQVKSKSGEEQYKVEVQKKSKAYRLVYNLQGVILDKAKLKVYSFDGSETNTDRDDNGGGSPIPPM